MKIRLTFKDPDHAVQVDGKNYYDVPRYVTEHCRKWVEYGEYVTIEIDTQDGSASVVPVDE